MAACQLSRPRRVSGPPQRSRQKNFQVNIGTVIFKDYLLTLIFSGKLVVFEMPDD